MDAPLITSGASHVAPETYVVGRRRRCASASSRRGGSSPRSYVRQGMATTAACTAPRSPRRPPDGEPICYNVLCATDWDDRFDHGDARRAGARDRRA